MAAYVTDSHSPRVSGGASPPTHAHAHGAAFITPVHSPHHSVTSSISSRTPVHTLSIHEYRRQQNTPNSQTVTPLGRTLRRKAAAPLLNPSEGDTTARERRSDSQSSLRPLHSSRSAHQLHSHRSPFQQQLFTDQLIRAQSAEPRAQGGSVSSISTTTSTGKVGHFKSRKRLPKPPAAIGSLPAPSNLAVVKPSLPRRPPLPAALDLPTQGSQSSGTRTPHTASTFSLSRFPKPPHLTDPSLSPPHNDSEHARISALSYVSAAPATPPATPATLHYRGASFDLVNPRDSLLLHDIVTPSRDFDSSEYLPIFTTEGAFKDLEDVCFSAAQHVAPTNHDQMAPKRALYGDLSAAYTGIRRREEDSFSSSNLDNLQPPVPAAVTPGSSTYTSPMYSPESTFAPPPLAVQKVSKESRFSLKQLTRTLTNKLGKTPERLYERELQDLRRSHTSIGTESGYPRAPQESYVSIPQTAYFPIGPTSPVTPTSPVSPGEQAPGWNDDEDEGKEVELPRKSSVRRYDSEPLASLIPDDNQSTQFGLVEDPRVSMSEGHLLSRPYYDDLDSIYPSSSIYTSDDRRKSNYQQSLASNRQSNPFVRFSGMNTNSFANEYAQDSLYGYSTDNHRESARLSRDMHRRSVAQGHTDTLSKIIDQYDPNVPNHEQPQGSTGTSILPKVVSESTEQLLSTSHAREASNTPRLSQFEFGLAHGLNNVQHEHVHQPMPTRKSTLYRNAGIPPCATPPPAPAALYGRAPFGLSHSGSSGMFSNQPSFSYGDTRQLLQMSPGGGPVPSASAVLQTSSSYSQPDVKPLEPSSSYSQADGIGGTYENTVKEQKHEEQGIPAMWARRNSGSMLLAKKSSSQAVDNRSECGVFDQEMPSHGDEADWESVAGHSYRSRESLDSIADYSSSEGSRNSLDLASTGSLPVRARPSHSQGPSLYSQPSPLPAHQHPFGSSPPQLLPHARMNTAPDTPSAVLASSPPVVSKTAPLFRLSTEPQDVIDSGTARQPLQAPWADRYGFSDKETQELLASGPNDEIIFDHEHDSPTQPKRKAVIQHAKGKKPVSSSPASPFDDSSAVERENTFHKLSVVGAKENLTGTPRGTGMHETGSSVADTSTLGQRLSSSATQGGLRSVEYPGFYASPFPAVGSITSIEQPAPPSEAEHERTPSQVTLFSKSTDVESPSARAGNHRSVRGSTTFQRAERRASRTAVPGQTKLRQMLLSPEMDRKTLSVDTSFSRINRGSDRPSTSDTTTPLRPHLTAEERAAFRMPIAHNDSPHLLCPERADNPEDEARRRKLSWAILAVFCLLPPCIMLHRVWGDAMMASLTKGRLGHCTNQSKKVALIAGIAVNVAIVTAIVVPIVVIHALGKAY
jgi:hypothetical protein